MTEEITLPKVTEEVNRREILNWERELIGLYVSDHPLSPVINELTQAVTHFSGQLAEASQNEKVRVAGMVTRIRPHQTKTGKSMAFVTIEDLQGVIELVVFPRTWDQYSSIIDFDKIILVDGRVDAAGAEPKVLVDTVTTEFKITPPLQNNGPFQKTSRYTTTGCFRTTVVPAPTVRLCETRKPSRHRRTAYRRKGMRRPVLHPCPRPRPPSQMRPHRPSTRKAIHLAA